MKSVVDFILKVLEVAGGTTVAAFLLIKFGGKWISDLLIEAFKTNGQKNLEKYKALVGTVQYVTHKRYDKEFEIYAEMTNALGKIIENMSKLIPESGVIKYPLEIEERKKYIKTTYKTMSDEYEKATSLICRYKPFIDDEIGYTDLLVLIREQITKVEKISDKMSADFLDEEDYNNTAKIIKMYSEICSNVRTYLFSLEII